MKTVVASKGVEYLPALAGICGEVCSQALACPSVDKQMVVAESDSVAPTHGISGRSLEVSPLLDGAKGTDRKECVSGRQGEAGQGRIHLSSCRRRGDGFDLGNFLEAAENQLDTLTFKCPDSSQGGASKQVGSSYRNEPMERLDMLLNAIDVEEEQSAEHIPRTAKDVCCPVRPNAEYRISGDFRDPCTLNASSDPRYISTSSGLSPRLSISQPSEHVIDVIGLVSVDGVSQDTSIPDDVVCNIEGTQCLLRESTGNLGSHKNHLRTGSDEVSASNLAYSKTRPLLTPVNGIVSHDSLHEREPNLDLDCSEQGMLTQGSSTTIAKSRSNERLLDHAELSNCSGSRRVRDVTASSGPHGSKSSRSAWQRKIPWDEQRHNSYKVVSEASELAGPSKGQLTVKQQMSVRSAGNGAYTRGQISDQQTISHTGSYSTPTPRVLKESFSDTGKLNHCKSVKHVQEATHLTAHNAFVARTREKWEFNQYWYSAHTIKVMAKEIEEIATKVAFLSTPSVYFSLKNGQLKKQSYFFDVDTQWAGYPNYVRFDYNQPLEVDESFHHAFDCVVIDPPFVTHEVWAKYAETAQLLLASGGKIILSTIGENSQFLKRLLQVEPQVFQPSIPHLVYQYLFFTNFPTKYLSVPNPEVP